ncbi:MAG: response regulator transcription factor [Bacteroidetes bacterium]|nr:response regulator transcription factor [Bacteroidota bacterium]
MSTDQNIYSLILADDHPFLRKGLKDFIETDPQFRVSAEAGNGEEALSLIRSLKPDFAVLDIDMPKMNGLEVATAVAREQLTTELIILTMHDKENMLNRALDLGVKGYLLKDSVVTEIRQALKNIVEGKHYIAPALSGFLIRRTVETVPDGRIGISLLTPMERRVLRLISESRTTKEIADELVISNRTVDSHRANICNKLDLHGPGSLIRFALENKQVL